MLVYITNALAVYTAESLIRKHRVTRDQIYELVRKKCRSKVAEKVHSIPVCSSLVTQTKKHSVSEADFSCIKRLEWRLAAL